MENRDGEIIEELCCQHCGGEIRIDGHNSFTDFEAGLIDEDELLYTLYCVDCDEDVLYPNSNRLVRA